MRRSTVESIKASASDLFAMEVDSSLLNDSQRLAWWLIGELRLNDGLPERAGDLGKTILRRYGKEYGVEYIRAILRALIAGGLPIESARSKGYWLRE